MTYPFTNKFNTYSCTLKFLDYQVQMSKAHKTTLQKTQDFFKTVEAGDISLFDNFDESIAVFGFSKTGKTSSCHILANSHLRSENSNGTIVYKPATQKYPNATVGNTPQSETEIPNIFQAKIQDKNKEAKTVVILDHPGYGDTYGFHRIFSNGYFHYRAFSKTPKLKFILAIKKADLEGAGKQFKDTLELFLRSFVSYNSIKNQIMNATSFLITQADPKSNIENLKKMIENLRDSSTASLNEAQKQSYQEFINHMLKNNKIFVIERPEQAGIVTKQTDLLKQIYDKTTFWERDIRGNNVDMSPINFSVASQILNGLFSFSGKALFKEEFEFFMGYMQNRIDQFLISHPYSLKNIVKILEQDAVESVQAHKFLEGMKNFNASFYKFNEAFAKKRDWREASLFHSNDLNESVQSPKGKMMNNEALQLERQQRQRLMKQMYFIKKFKVLQFIKNISMKTSDKADVVRDVKWLDSISADFIQMFKKFNYLRIEKSDSQKIIYKYTYIIQRLIQECKILTLILFSNKDANAKFDEYKMGMEMVEITRTLRDDLFIYFSEINTVHLKETFIQKINFHSFETVNKEVIIFFESIPHLNNKTLFKVAKMISRYAEIIIQKKKNIPEEEKRYVAKKLFQYISGFYQLLKNVIKDGTKQEKENCIETIFILTNHLGCLLQGFQMYEEAREVCQSLNNSELVLNMFETQIKINESNPAKTRQLLIKYGKYAGQCHRSQLAVKCFQQAYAKSTTFQQMKEASNLIIKLKTANPDIKDDEYLMRFINEEYFNGFSETLKSRMNQMYQQEEMLS